MEKMTMAKRNEIAREDVIRRIFKEEVLGTELLQVAGSKFMINANCNGEIVPIRVDLVAVKIDENDSLQFAEDFHDEYVNKEEQKRLDKEEKAKAKENIDSNKIYLVPSSTTGSSNIYDEYIYVEERWELIGNTQVDLSNYYTKTESDNNYAMLSLYNPTSINMGRAQSSTVGEFSTATGEVVTATGEASHAEGYYTNATAYASHAEGSTTTAGGFASHAEGNETYATGYYSHTEGSNTAASGDNSHAEGNFTSASGSSSHAEGSNNYAVGVSSHAEGLGTTANGDYSHTEGYNTIASGRRSHVQGENNIEDKSSQYAHIVGNGKSSSKRSNAHTLDWSGNAWFSGDVYTGSTSGTNKDDGSKKLATEEFVNNKIIASTTDIGVGAELADGTIYLVYEE